MSADNGIYILQSKDGFRIAHAQAIENIYWNFEKKELTDEINPKILYDYFHKSPVFKTVEEVTKEAIRIYEEIIQDDFCPIVEYGICDITGWEDKEFPKEGTNEKDI
jgi:hypothetical protein